MAAARCASPFACAFDGTMPAGTPTSPGMTGAGERTGAPPPGSGKRKPSRRRVSHVSKKRGTCWRCGMKASPHAWISSSALSATSSSSRPILEPNVRATAAIESMNFLVATCVWNAVWQFFTRVSVSVRLVMTTRGFLCWIRLRIRRTASLSLAVREGVERGEGGERTVRGGGGARGVGGRWWRRDPCGCWPAPRRDSGADCGGRGRLTYTSELSVELTSSTICMLAPQSTVFRMSLVACSISPLMVSSLALSRGSHEAVECLK
mmetsp:Transcript_3513/g.7292  ORF Transcript_3513/g.7292 Transcript_3513/m.7292 type:complete len:264 (-) Transcript_3513:92-883(-)